MVLQGKRIAVLAENDYHETELWYPLLRMQEEGADVRVIGMKGVKEYTSKHGFPVAVDSYASEVSADELDAIIIPGGFAPDRMRRHQPMLGIVKGVYEKGGIVAAICHAGWVLISAGIVKGKKATCVSAIKDDMVNAGARYVDAEVVRDGNLITSRGPKDLPAFCRVIIEALRK